jgi:hypothetical protein
MCSAGAGGWIMSHDSFLFLARKVGRYCRHLYGGLDYASQIFLIMDQGMWRVRVDISPSSQPDRALSALSYGLKPNCNLSQSPHGHTPIACTHTTGNSKTHMSQVSYRNLIRSQYKQGCNHCEQSYTQV